MARADDYARELFVVAVAGPDFAQALAQRQAELLAQDVTAADLDAWREELADLEQVQGTRFYSDAMRRRHEELRRTVDQATAQLLAQPDLQALVDLPRTEAELRRAWERWDIAGRRAWLRRLVERIEVKPAAAGTRAEARLVPIFRL
jgi:hypothetical protein